MDLEKVLYAKEFIDKMANGINPVDGSQIPENDLVNNVKITRFLFYVSELLGEIYQNGGIQKQSNKSRETYHVEQDVLDNFPFSKAPISVSDIVAYFNQNIDTTKTKKLQVKAVTNWLIKSEYLELVEREDGKHTKLPTEKGNGIGIIVQQRIGQYGTYQVVLYGLEAQKFVVENLETMISEYSAERQQDRKYLNQGGVWTDEQDASLTEMFKDGLTVAEISNTLQRSPAGIRARLKRLGLISSRSEAL